MTPKQLAISFAHIVMASAYGDRYQITVGRRKPEGDAKKREYARRSKRPTSKRFRADILMDCFPERYTLNPEE
jgi:hypothetical protein